MIIKIIKTHTSEDACVRLQSEAIYHGLANNNKIKCTIHSPEFIDLFLPDADYICFHYNDVKAINFLRENKPKLINTRFICFGSDIYNFEKYSSLEKIVDIFILPTNLHKSILSSQITTSIFSLTEPVDPIALVDFENTKFPIKRSKKLCWYGYPESFYKSMLSLTPIINSNIDSGAIHDFTLITDIKRFPNDFNHRIKSFDTNRLAKDLRAYDYTLLSHLPLDLHINSLIKSPNKAITALIAGVIPLASDTPAYRELFVSLGLERFLFDSPKSLDKLLKRLNPDEDSSFIHESNIPLKILNKFNYSNTTEEFLNIIQIYQNESASFTSLADFKSPPSYVEFTADRLSVRNRFSRVMKKLQTIL